MRARIALAAAFALVVLAVAPTAASVEPSSPLDGCSTAFGTRTVAADDPLAPCPGVRPGGALIVPSDPFEIIYCSMAFLVTDGRDVYVSTAGHCTLEEFGVPKLGEAVHAHGVRGPVGKVAYTWCEGQAANGGCAAGTDFALIRLNANGRRHASPAMCTWSAPSSIFRAHDATVRELRHFGWGIGIGGGGIGLRSGGGMIQPGNPVTQSRRSAGLDFIDPNLAIGWGAAISGDSGSGVLVADLPGVPSLEQPAARALGVLTHIGAGGVMGVQRLDLSLAKAGRDMKKRFRLWTRAR